MQLGKFNITLDAFIYAPRLVRVAIILIISLSFFMIGLWFDTFTQIKGLSADGKKEIQLKQELKIRYTDLASIPAYEQQNQQFLEIVKNFLNSLPDQTEVPDVIDRIRAQAKEAGLNVVNIELGTPIDEKYYFLIQVKMNARADYQQLANFITDIDDLGGVMVVNSFTMLTVPDKKNMIDLQLTINLYRHINSSKLFTEGSS